MDIDDKVCNICDNEILDDKYIIFKDHWNDFLFRCYKCIKPFCFRCRRNKISDLLTKIKYPCAENDLLCSDCQNSIPFPENVGYYGNPTFDYCDRCGRGIAGGDGNNEKECEKCDKNICLDCTAITGCQTTWGICKDCYTHLCRNCHQKIIEDDNPVLPYIDEYTYCSNCK